jgi:hypothetical protein
LIICSSSTTELPSSVVSLSGVCLDDQTAAGPLGLGAAPCRCRALVRMVETPPGPALAFSASLNVKALMSFAA